MYFTKELTEKIVSDLLSGRSFIKLEGTDGIRVLIFNRKAKIKFEIAFERVKTEATQVKFSWIMQFVLALGELWFFDYEIVTKRVKKKTTMLLKLILGQRKNADQTSMGDLKKRKKDEKNANSGSRTTDS